MVETGWAGFVAEQPQELPAGEAGRTLAEVLRGPDTPETRAAAREAKRAEAERRAGRELPDTQQWLQRVRGQEGVTAAEVVARAGAVREPGASKQAELRRAREILAQHGLDGLLPGRIDGIFDANLGHLDVPRRQALDADTPRDIELGRMREDLAENRAWMRRFTHRQPSEAARSQPLPEVCAGPDCQVCRAGREADAQRAREATRLSTGGQPSALYSGEIVR